MQKNILKFIYGIAIRNFLKTIIGVQSVNRKSLQDVNQFIIVANHNSHLDTMSIMASIPKSKIHLVKPVAAKDHFGKTKTQERLSNYFINTLLIERKRDIENPENDPIYQMISALDNGFSLILFPEGTRGEPEVRQPLKPGIAMVLKERPHIPYIPAYLKGMGKALPKNDNLILPYQSTLIFGEPKFIGKNNSIHDILEQIGNDIYKLDSNI